MFWRHHERKVRRTETDACKGCDIWDQPCELRERLTEFLKAGMHLDITFCPHLRPPLGGKAHG